MGGQEGSRGYLYQSIVSLLNACTEQSWETISVEYTTSDDKAISTLSYYYFYWDMLCLISPYECKKAKL